MGDRKCRSFFYGYQMQNKLREDQFFQHISALLRPTGLLVVDAKKQKGRVDTHAVVIITNSDHTVGIDECTQAHKIIFARLALETGREHLDLEDSTPGVQRVFKDVWEFFLFTGKRCRVYDNLNNCWAEGIITEPTETEIVLSDVSIDDSKQLLQDYRIRYENVQKAKLAYAWEDMK